ncbi:hypothetical protein [Sorangium sp. So ce131]|uniref:hypothetical protein n=1 Tax=Sorangium sp. So ce131 TaxID=3133282 RepID=UPI003F60FED3
MTNRNPNKSPPGQPAGQGAAGDAAPQPQPQQPQQQPPRGYDAPGFGPQEHPSLAQPRALPHEPRRRPEEGAPAPAAAPAERVMQWGEPRPRRRQDREAGPSDKQVYVPPVTLPPNREHQAMDLQKIQVAPSLLKGVDERNRPTMRRIPVQGLPARPPGIPDDPGAPRSGGARTARVGVGSGVWPPPDEDLSGARGQSARKQRPQAAAVPVATAVAPRAGQPSSTRTEATVVTAAASAAALAARRRRAPLGLFALLVFLGSATAAGFWALWRAANPPIDDGSTSTVESGSVPAPGRGATTPTIEPPPPIPAPVPREEPPPSAEPPVAAAPEASTAAPAADASASRAHPEASVQAARAPAVRPRPVVRPRPSAKPDDVYESIENKPAASAASAGAPPSPSPPPAPSPPPGTTAPPRPFGH